MGLTTEQKPMEGPFGGTSCGVLGGDPRPVPVQQRLPAGGAPFRAGKSMIFHTRSLPSMRLMLECRQSGPGAARRTGAGMQAQFCGGPYDGMELDEEIVNRCARPVPRGSGENFIRMPPREDWEAVMRAEKPKDGPFHGPCPVYERVLLAEGVEFRFEAGAGFRDSVATDPESV